MLIKKNLTTYWNFLKTLNIERYSNDYYKVYQVLRYFFLENNSFAEILENFIKRKKVPDQVLRFDKTFR